MSEMIPSIQIGELIKLRNDKSKQLKSLDYRRNGILPIVDQGASLICGYTDDLSKRYEKELPVIIFGDHTLHTKFIDFDFAVGADGTQIIVPSNKSDDIRYLYYLILMVTELIGSEGYKRHLNILKEFYIPYIKHPVEQQKIASILTSVDEVIEKTQSQINKLQDLKKSVMNELLTRGIGHTKFKDSELGRIPKSWEVKPLLKLTKGRFGIVDGPFGSNLKTEHYKSEGIPVIQSGFVTTGQFRAKKYVYVDDEKFNAEIRSAVKNGDIVMAKIGAQAGRCAIMPTGHPTGILAGNSLKITTDEESLLAKYLQNLLSHLYITGEIQNLRTETAQPAISIATLKRYKVKVPSLLEQRKIIEVLSAIETKLESSKEKSEKFQFLKKSLMQDLLTGKVRVSVN